MATKEELLCVNYSGTSAGAIQLDKRFDGVGVGVRAWEGQHGEEKMGLGRRREKRKVTHLQRGTSNCSAQPACLTEWGAISSTALQ